MRINKQISDFLIVLMGSGLARLFLFMTSIIVARTLEKSEYGQFSLFYIAFNIVPLFAQAFDTTYIRYAKNLEPGETKTDYLRINVSIKIFYFLLIWCSSLFLLEKLYGGHLKELSPLILYSSGAVGGAAICFSYSLASYFQEQGRFLTSTLAETSYCFVIFTGVGAMFLLGVLNNLNQIFLLYISVAMFSGAIFLWLLIQITGPIWKVRKHQVITFFTIGKWVFLTTLVMYLFPRLDVIVLAKYVSFADIGTYAAANSLIMLLALFSRSLNKVILPKAMNEAITSTESFRKFSREVMLSSGLIVLVSLILFFMAKKAILVIYGPEYLASAGIFRVLIGGYLCSMLYLPYSFIFYALSKAHLRFFMECTKVALALALLLTFIPFFGIIGAAWAITITMAANAACSFFILRRKITVHFDMKQGSKASYPFLPAESKLP